MDESTAASLEEEFKRLREKYMDCEDCPPERNCCTFQGDYTQVWGRKQLFALFDEETLEGLLEDEKLIQIGIDQYELLDTRCPGLGCDNSCTLYAKREELGLDSCMDFPLYNIGMGLPIVVVDYRCHSVEENWDEIFPALRELSQKYSANVYVRYFTKEDYGGDLPLADFDRFRDAGGVIPPQRMG